MAASKNLRVGALRIGDAIYAYHCTLEGITARVEAHTKALLVQGRGALKRFLVEETEDAHGRRIVKVLRVNLDGHPTTPIKPAKTYLYDPEAPTPQRARKGKPKTTAITCRTL
jgi:hypothetical protein